MADSRDNSTASGGADEPVMFEWSFLGPRYWATWFQLGILRLLMFAPRRTVMSLGAWIGDQFRTRNRKRRRIVEVNLSLCFPEKSEAEREQLMIEHFRAYGRGVLDMGLMLWASEKRLRELIDVEGYEEHRDLVARERVLLIAWHLTTMEITSAILSLSGPAVSMMKPIGNPLLTWIVHRGRRHRADIVLVTRDAGFRPLIRGIRSGRQCYLFPDEDFGEAGPEVVFVPFFGVERALITSPSRIARAARARVSVCASTLDASTGRYRCTVTPPLEGVKGEDAAADLRVICSAMEDLIRRAPEQYLWTLRWFRTRPDGAESPYDPVGPG